MDRVSSGVWRLKREHNIFEEWQAFILARIEFPFKLVPAGMVGKGQIQKEEWRDFPSGTVDKRPPGNEGDTGSIPGPGSHIPWSN